MPIITEKRVWEAKQKSPYSASAGVQYDSQRLYIKQILDHREYDKGHWKE
jgi:mRNA-degrading endonuclease HigB of HigAB toxin-antitoxin module